MFDQCNILRASLLNRPDGRLCSILLHSRTFRASVISLIHLYSLCSQSSVTCLTLVLHPLYLQHQRCRFVRASVDFTMAASDHPVNRRAELLSVQVSMAAVAVLVVALRLVSRFVILRSPGWDDYIITMGTASGHPAHPTSSHS